MAPDTLPFRVLPSRSGFRAGRLPPGPHRARSPLNQRAWSTVPSLLRSARPDRPSPQANAVEGIRATSRAAFRALHPPARKLYLHFGDSCLLSLDVLPSCIPSADQFDGKFIREIGLSRIPIARTLRVKACPVCAEVQVNLAYRWFCKHGIEDKIPDHSVFCRARHERFRESDAPRRVFEEIAVTQTALERFGRRFDLRPQRLAGDTVWRGQAAQVVGGSRHHAARSCVGQVGASRWHLQPS